MRNENKRILLYQIFQYRELFFMFVSSEQSEEIFFAVLLSECLLFCSALHPTLEGSHSVRLFKTQRLNIALDLRDGLRITRGQDEDNIEVT